MAKIAFLIYNKTEKNNKRGRKETASFDGQSNVGAYMIIHAMTKAGFKIDFCSPDTAKLFDIVLVSLTSPYDVYNLLSVIARHPDFQPEKRTFQVIIGGFGVINIISLRNYIDFAFFGRVENEIAADVKEILANKDIVRPYVMSLKHGIHEVKLNQSQPYPHELEIRPNNFKEKHIGCPRKCLFCQYTFSRKWTGKESDFFEGSMGYNTGGELIFNQILPAIENNIDCLPKGRMQTAIDGFSERLRMAFNKRYSNEMIIETLEKLSEVWPGNRLLIHLYMIGSYPTETEEDFQEFIRTIQQVKPKGKQIVIKMHVSAFRASPLTPAAYLPVNIHRDWRAISQTRKLQKWGGDIYLGENISLAWDMYIESGMSHFKQVLIERATEESDSLIHTILFSKKLEHLKKNQQLIALKHHFDLMPYIREYDVNEKLPTWYLESYIPNKEIRHTAQKLKRTLWI